MILTPSTAYGSLSYGGFYVPPTVAANVSSDPLELGGDIVVASRMEGIRVVRKVDSQISISKRTDVAVTRRRATISVRGS